MGLIKAAKDSISTMLADQWLEYFICESMPADTLVVKGQKRVNDGRNSNTKASDNIISNGSTIVVNEGQCMIIVDQGGVVDLCAEAGAFVYEASSEPSLFYGNLGENVKNTFTTFWKRFTYGGNTAKDQRVYYFNTKEIIGNRFGTASPIEFHLVSPKTGFEFDTVVKCRGEYTFKIVDPLLFYKNVCGNITADFNTTSGEGANLLSNMKTDLLSFLPEALSPVAAQGVMPYQLGSYTGVICESLKAALSDKWTKARGIEMVSLNIIANVPEEARDALNQWNNTVMLKDLDMDRARKSEAFSNMMEKSQLGGEGGGDAMNGMMDMMAMNMMGGMMGGNNMMGGMMGGSNMMGGNNGYAQQPQQPAYNAAPAAAPVLGWTCSCGKTDNRGKFCAECGSPKPVAAGWTCSCGHVNQGKFCQECGSRKPAGAPMYKCDKCGWEPEDPANPPKFCPECGDAFDENDIK